MCHSTHVEVRGQLCGVGFLLSLLHGSQRLNKLPGLCSPCLVCWNRVLLCTPSYPWNHDLPASIPIVGVTGFILSGSKLTYIFKFFKICVCTCTCSVHAYSWTPEAGVECPKVRIIGGFQPLEMGAGTKTWYSQQEQQVLLTAEPSFQPLIILMTIINCVDYVRKCIYHFTCFISSNPWNHAMWK